MNQNHVDRITSLTLNNFRGFRDKHTFDLDADLIFLTGKNGVGKSSLLYAIDLLLHGETNFLKDKNFICNQKGQGEKTTLDASFSSNSEEKRESIEVTSKGEIKGGDNHPFPEISEAASLLYQENIELFGSKEILSNLSPETPIDMKKVIKRSDIPTWIDNLKKIYITEPLELEEIEKQDIRVFVKHMEEIKEIVPDLFNPARIPDFVLKNDNLPEHVNKRIKNFITEVTANEELKNYQNISLVKLFEIFLEKLKQTIEEQTKTDKDQKEEDRRKLQTIKGKYNDIKIDGLSVVSEKASLPFFITSDNIKQYEKKISTISENIRREEEQLSRLRKELNWGKSDRSSGNNFVAIFNFIDTFCQDMPASLPEEIRSWLKEESSKTESMRNLYEEWHKTQKEKEEKLQDQSHSLKKQRNILNDSLTLSEIIGRREIVTPVILSDLIDREPDNVMILSKLSKFRSSLEEEIENLKEAEEKIKKIEKKAPSVKKIKDIIEKVESTYKKETGTKALLSTINELPFEKARELTETMNELLSIFHFENSFIPIGLKKTGTGSKSSFEFTTETNLPYDQLSTGQQTQLGFCWTLGLNYALTNTLKHRIVMVDDLTTSLDMAQLVPASVLLRQMAYADKNSPKKRQVIITSHHEDLTNKILDFLIPPDGYDMKVISFNDWNPEKGPNCIPYEIKQKSEIPNSDIENIREEMRNLHTR